MTTLEDIQKRIASNIDQDYAGPTPGDTNWELRKQYINQALSEWGQAYDWQVLYKEYNTLTSVSTGNASISLPSDYRKIASYPRVGADELPKIFPQDKGLYTSSDKYFYEMGNNKDGYTMVVSPGTSNGYISSGASIQVSYFAVPTALVSGSDESPCPDAEFLVSRACEFLFRAADDPRFTVLKQEADTRIARMLERENTQSVADDNFSRIRTREEQKGFRVGRDG